MQEAARLDRTCVPEAQWVIKFERAPVETMVRGMRPEEFRREVENHVRLRAVTDSNAGVYKILKGLGGKYELLEGYGKR